MTRSEVKEETTEYDKLSALINARLSLRGLDKMKETEEAKEYLNQQILKQVKITFPTT